MSSTILVTGGTGVLGRGVVARLVTSGHTVRAVARSPERADLLRDLGAEPLTIDLFDAAAVKGAVAGCDAILHLATSIPPIQRARSQEAWRANDRLRRDATRLLVDAALAHGVRTFVAESITFPYADGGDAWLEEDSPVDAGDAAMLQSVFDLEREVARFTAGSGGRGIVLRFGLFYGPEARSTDEALRAARAGLAFVVGPPDTYLSSVHTDDAAEAVVAALTAPAGTYNVVDDEPLTRRAHNDAFTAAFGLRRGRFLPAAVMRRLGGPGVSALSRSQRVSNRRFRQATGWAPRWRDAVAGWATVAAAHGVPVRAPLHLRLPLALLTLVGFGLGAWAAFAPRSFFDDFPGLGQVWVAVDGPFNEHLVRDFGALNLALGLLAFLAFRSPTRALVIAAAGAWLAYGVPHLVYHVRHLAPFDGADAAAMLASLVLLLALALLALAAARAPKGTTAG